MVVVLALGVTEQVRASDRSSVIANIKLAAIAAPVIGISAGIVAGKLDSLKYQKQIKPQEEALEKEVQSYNVELQKCRRLHKELIEQDYSQKMKDLDHKQYDHRWLAGDGVLAAIVLSVYGMIGLSIAAGDGQPVSRKDIASWFLPFAGIGFADAWLNVRQPYQDHVRRLDDKIKATQAAQEQIKDRLKGGWSGLDWESNL